VNVPRFINTHTAQLIGTYAAQLICLAFFIFVVFPVSLVCMAIENLNCSSHNDIVWKPDFIVTSSLCDIMSILDSSVTVKMVSLSVLLVEMITDLGTCTWSHACKQWSHSQMIFAIWRKNFLPPLAE